MVPSIDLEQFEERKTALKGLLNSYVQPLIDRIEEQTAMLIDKDRELKKVERRLKLLPDFERQANQQDEEVKLKHFENLALRKQLELLKLEQVTAEKVSKLSNSIIGAVERSALELQGKLQEELEQARLQDMKLLELQNEVEELRKPWWKKILSS